MNEDQEIKNNTESVELANSTSESEVVISVNQLSKIYKLYPNNEARLKEALHPLRKKYHTDFYALNNISFNVHKGEVLGIIGANGSGKSTLLMAIAGILQPSTGNVMVNGRISSLIELGSGFNPEFTGMENIYFMGSIIGYTKQEMDGKVKDIIDFADIGEFIYQPVKTYSSGMMARLAFSLALLVDPDILIIDEALSVGDLRFQQKAIRAMRNLMGKAKAILFVTHSVATVRTLCNRAIWIKDGQIFQDGDPARITRNYYAFMRDGLVTQDEDGEDVLDVEQNKDLIKELSSRINDKTEIMWDDISKCAQDGNGSAQIMGVALYTINPFKKIYILKGGEWVCFLSKIQIIKDIEFPAISIYMFDNLQNSIIGINSFFYKKEIPPLKAGEQAFAKFEFKMPKIKNGDYFFTPTISNRIGNDKEIYHRVYDSCIIKIDKMNIKQNQGSLIIIEDANVEIEKINK
ncbi:MAG: ABC transporter ATP-binding protein [Spirochaetota bacterium]